MAEILWSEFEEKVFSTIQPDGPDHLREEETRSKSHANPACFKAAPGWCPITGKGTGQMRLRLPNNVRSESVVLPETRLHHTISDRAVVPDGRIVSADRAQDYSWTRRGGLRLLMWRWQPYSITIILLLLTIPPMQIQLVHYLSMCICIEITVHTFCNLCCIKVSFRKASLCCIMTIKLPCTLHLVKQDTWR